MEKSNDFRPCLALVLILVFVIHAPGQNAALAGNAGPKSIEIARVVNESANKFMSDQHSVGLSVGIIKDGRSWTYNFGEVEKRTTIPPSQHTIYELASITKTFTGVLLAQAVVERKVKLDDDVRRYLDGSYPNLEFEGQPIPEILVSGDHAKVAAWRLAQSEALTRARRPDLWANKAGPRPTKNTTDG